MLTSMVCRFEHFKSDWYQRFATRLSLDDTRLPENQRNLHRKVWEFCAISQALAERGMLQPGRKGFGFAVGQEPLPSLFASYGVDVVATDLATDESARMWVETRQHAESIDVLYKDLLLDRATFDKHVEFRFADMRNLSELASEQCDFVWSSCAFEHLGNLEAGLDFVVEAMRLVKPGGIAVHTTEYNVSSNDDTVAEGDAVVYRRCDLERLSYRLRGRGCGMGMIDYDAGTHPYDLNADIPPYYVTGRKHIKLTYGGYVTTSLLLIVFKG